MAGAIGMFSTTMGRADDVRKALAVPVSLSRLARAFVPAAAAATLSKAIVKLSRTLAACTLRLTALRGTAASVATVVRREVRTSAVKSETAPATMTVVVARATVGGSGGAGDDGTVVADDGGGGNDAGSGDAGAPPIITAAAAPPSAQARTTRHAPRRQ